uniref:NADH-ubiquinone oxidoreductase chain 2 n=1 Tax=Strahlaxius plectrorhynchus TaxID=2302681 RepID=A0A4Y5QM16_9EUCA|nr:NADH dehydrogenase subunit 2 [Strahlaxius plectrorhynchus]QCX31791.1 NADH dehydrogenase subunit 2 [Strahlaxius plectrorhynchus]
MMISSSSVMFLTMLVSGIVLSVSADSWFGAWCGLELNMMSFIPFICFKDNQYTAEAALKYFLVQAFGSSMLIFSAMSLMYYSAFTKVICVSLLLKLGAAPLHFWFPQVLEGLSWPQCAVLMTLQKVAPMVLLTYVMKESVYIIYFSAILSALVGAFGGINQTMLRKLLAYSSINHMSWMLFALKMSENIWFMYFIMYSIISISIVVLFHNQGIIYMSQLVNTDSSFSTFISFMGLLSLGGLPPFTGFLPKWFIVQELSSNGIMIPLIILFLTSLVTLYYYLRVTYFHLVLMSSKLKWVSSFDSSRSGIIFFSVLNLYGLAVPSLFFMI